MALLILLTIGLSLALVYALLAGADTLTADFNLTGNALYTKDLNNRVAYESFQIGSNNFPSLTQSYTTGTGTDQVNKYYVRKYTIAAGANQDIDLNAVVIDDLGTTVSFTAIKELLVALDAPDGTLSVRVGPQAVANAWQGPHGGVAAGNYTTVFKSQRFTHPYAGWTVTAATADILRINNPGGTSVDVHVAILGS